MPLDEWWMGGGVLAAGNLIDFFESLTPAEAEDFKDRFVSATDDAIDLFRSRVLEVTELPAATFDYSDGSLAPILAAILPIFRVEDDPRNWALGRQPIWADYSAGAPHIRWIVDGWIHYFAEVLERSGPLGWDWERDQGLMTANQPILTGFLSGMRLAPFFGPASLLANAARKDDPGLAAKSIARWRTRVPEDGNERVLKRPFSGYTDQHVQVSRAHAKYLDEDALWPHASEDFHGAWRVDLEEGIDVVVGPGTVEDLLAHLRELSGVEAAAWGGEDTLVVRADAVSSDDLLAAVLDWLNTRWNSRGS